MNNEVIETEYANTDFDLKSKVRFDTLHHELLKVCRVLHYTEGNDGDWHSIVEADHEGDSHDRKAAMDISTILDALHTLSVAAKRELSACYLREFNVGIECGDTWGYVHQIPPSVVHAVAEAECSIAITLYPMRNADGTRKG